MEDDKVYYVFLNAPSAPCILQGIFTHYSSAKIFAEEASGYRVIRWLPSFAFGKLPEYKETNPL